MSHPNSRTSLKQTDKEQRQRQILDVLTRERKAMTDREIMRYLGFTDPNMVRPRITELLAAGTIREAGNKFDSGTLRTVRTVIIEGRLF
jgi:hypothetical protein